MDTSLATLKTKKSELVFKEVPSGRSRSRGPLEEKTRAFIFSLPSPGSPLEDAGSDFRSPP